MEEFEGGGGVGWLINLKKKKKKARGIDFEHVRKRYQICYFTSSCALISDHASTPTAFSPSLFYPFLKPNQTLMLHQPTDHCARHLSI